MGVSDSSPEILPWLKTLPLAPEYRPTLAEFQDPISYILKIEKEASKFGICKIIPPLPPCPKKTVISNFNRSLSSGNPNPKKPPTFTTRQQQIGFCPRKPRPVKKPVWQSGESYTFQQFEAKARQFEKAQLRKTGKKSLSALEIETLFWKACADKPFSVEYANDMPGSAFSEVNSRTGDAGGAAGGETVGETAWNMRGVSRAKGSLLRFMKEEIPGVTSPMVYVAMMFSWFAWHVEDHDLHSLNYLHLGAAKTWYGVPRDAAVAFEEVVRVHGYGGQVNALVTFAILGEKTTVMSPEVLIDTGVPCCRLVQNAGEFVVTFPRAYHSGFSHGFNCGEAANIATPEWVKVAKEAAIRRASINYPPMVSHFQLLYALALALYSRGSTCPGAEPRSSRLKDRKRDEGETMLKEQFVRNIIQNNDLLYVLLEKGSSCVLLPPDACISPSSHSHSRLGYQIRIKPSLSLGLCSAEEAMEASEILLLDDTIPYKNPQMNCSGFHSETAKPSSLQCESKRVPSVKYSRIGSADLYTSHSHPKHANYNKEGMTFSDGLLDQGLLPCVTCGILSFACVAVIQPREAAARYLMTADCGFLTDQIVGSTLDIEQNATSSDQHLFPGLLDKGDENGLVDVVIQCGDYQLQVANKKMNSDAETVADKGVSALDLLASAYADSSDSDAELIIPDCVDSNGSPRRTLAESCSLSAIPCDTTEVLSCRPQLKMWPYETRNCRDFEIPVSVDPLSVEHPDGKFSAVSPRFSHCSDIVRYDKGMDNAEVDTTSLSDNNSLHMLEKVANMSVNQRFDKDSSRMHIFCLEHALEVERQLHPVGGVEMLLLCHQDYPKLEAQAKLFAADVDLSYGWKDIPFKEATEEDKEKIKTALDDEEVIPLSQDWAVRLGVNLYYSSNLSKSPLYSTQMPYNPVIYKVFGRDLLNTISSKPRVYSRRKKKQKTIVVAGKWCGKVWMSNQVHPYLAHDNTEVHEDEEICTWNRDQKMSPEQTKAVISTVNSDWKNGGRKQNTVELDHSAPIQQQWEDKITHKEGLNVKPLPRVRARQHKDTVKNAEEGTSGGGGPSMRLRRRPVKAKETRSKSEMVELKTRKRKRNRVAFCSNKVHGSTDILLKDEDAEHKCDIEGCFMGFSTKQELVLHKRNICCVKGCGKKFFSHKYLVQHRRVHLDDRPLKCPWKGCNMSFKWAWARTEHIRVHTGDRPYVCREVGCGQTFRFVSDFSRHKRKTGHSTKKKGKG